MACAFLFPGQGSQAVGMGRSLAAAFPAAREVFEEVDDALNYKLARLMFEGPESDLTLTENAQPALMTASIAVLRVLEREGGIDLRDKVAFVAGHSLGEYSALAAARTFDLGDTARLLRRRGQAMQRAVPVGDGAMAALLGLDLEAAQAIAAEAVARTPEGSDPDICDVANDNAPGQVVVSGHKAAVERAVAVAAERGAKRSVLLPVSAPFHCRLMQPAADEMQKALAGIVMRQPTVPLVANVTAAPVSDPDTVRDLLVRQVTGMVRWRESVLAMRRAGVSRTFELGAGKVLTGLVKRIDREVAGQSVGEPGDIETVLKLL